MEHSQLYYEDLKESDTFEFGGYTLTEEEIITFATEFDPQPFHLDPEKASDTIFGELVASGLHTMCLCCRMAIEDVLNNISLVTGIGFDRIRFTQPVKPGDELSGTVEVAEKQPQANHRKADRVAFEITGVNQNDETVVTLTDLVLVERRTVAE